MGCLQLLGLAKAQRLKPGPGCWMLVVCLAHSPTCKCPKFSPHDWISYPFSNAKLLLQFFLIAEITHRCPLHCLYCSNPLELTSRKEELATADWLRVFAEAAALGAPHFTSPEASRWCPGSGPVVTGARAVRVSIPT